MHFVSIAVLLYQAVIFSIIIAASVISGRTACVISTLLLCMWTLTHVFFPPLMVLQFIVIVISFVIGMSVSSVTKESNQYSKATLSSNNMPTKHYIETNYDGISVNNNKYMDKMPNCNIKRYHVNGKIVYGSIDNEFNYVKVIFIFLCLIFVYLFITY